MVSHLVKPKKQQSKIGGFITLLFNKFKDTPVDKLPEVGLYIYLTYASVVRFKSISMGWYGPLALKLALTPSTGEGGSVSVGVMGGSVSLPNTQQIGIAMLAVLGLLGGIADIPPGWFAGDSSPLDPEGILKENAEKAAVDYIPPGATEPFTTFEEFIEFGREGIQ